MKKISAYGLLFCSLASTFASISYADESTYVSPLASTSENNAFKNVHLQKSSTLYKLDITYPKTAGRGVNAAINSYIKGQIKEFGKNIKESGKPENGVAYELIINYDYSHYNKLGSITFSSYYYLGGAHGMTTLSTINFDTKKGTVLTHKDLFADTKVAYKAIADKLYTQLMAESKEKVWVDTKELKDALSTDNALDNLRFTAKGLQFASEPYQVGPYAAGIITTTIAYKDISSLFSKTATDYLK